VIFSGKGVRGVRAVIMLIGPRDGAMGYGGKSIGGKKAGS
jgi:hypothetical protein